MRSSATISMRAIAPAACPDMTVLDYAMMIEDTHVNTQIIEYRRRGPDSFMSAKERWRTDRGGIDRRDGRRAFDGLFFFLPHMQERSLGTHMILDHIERARAAGLPHVYLGYWVEGSAKMQYKIRFTPQEHLGPRGWQRFEG